MKAIPSISLRWGCALLIALLLVLATAALMVGRGLERQVLWIEADVVPGLIGAQQIRSAHNDGFICAQFALDAANASERDAQLRRMSEFADRGRTAIERYRRTIHINPEQDTENLRTVTSAWEEHARAREQFLRLMQSGAADEARRWFHGQLRSTHEALLRACDVLVAYNDRTGTILSAGMLKGIALLRWAAVAVMVLALGAAIAVLRNLLEQQRTNRALRESERKFATAFQVSPLSMVISNRTNGRVIDANDAFKQWIGVRGRDAIGKTTRELGVWSSDAERGELMEQLRLHGNVRNFLKEMTLPDGRKRMMLLSVEPLQLDGDDCILTVGQDLTELLEAQQARAQSAAELRVVFENSALGIALVNAEGRIVRCNPALERFLGYRSDELCTKTIADVTHPADVDRDVQLFQRLVRQELSHYQLEKRYVRKDGMTVHGHLTVSVVRDAGGRLAFGIGMVEDVTDQRQAEEALLESEAARQNLQQQLIVAQKLEALGQLAGGVAHDFNNMLAAMMLYLDLLKGEKALSPDMRDSLSELSNATRRAAGLTRQLLLFSRREPAQRQAVDLNAVVAGLLKMLNRLIGEHFVLEQVGGAAPLWLHADPGMLEQVVMNLVVNARDAMPRGGRILLRLDAVEVDAAHAKRIAHSRAGRFVRLTVTDTGIGMSAQTQARIFEPFFTTKAVGHGTGLGLSTVFGIVQQHLGWIEVESEEGKGSAFAVYLPAHSGPASERLQDAAPVPVAKGRETILLVEDSEQVRLVTAKILRQHGYQVREAANGRVAQTMLDQQPGEVDLLLTDMVLPGGILGDELTANLSNGYPPPKVILMSGHSSPIDGFDQRAAGRIYLTKPFDAERLLRTVRSAFDGVTSQG